MTDIVVGIDIGGTNTKVGVSDESGEILIKGYVPTASDDSNSFLKALRYTIDELLMEIDDDFDLKGIGVGSPVANYRTGTVAGAANLNWSEPINLVEWLEGVYKVPVKISNDANVAALGEKIFGAAREMEDFITITLGTGLGCGVISNGHLVQGHQGLAGELGHTVIKARGRKCSCGRRGCLETYVSATGLKRTAYNLISDLNGLGSELCGKGYHQLSASLIAMAANEGDLIAKKAFDLTGEILGLQLANASVILGPQAIFLVGGLAEAGDLIFRPTIKSFKKNLLKNLEGDVQILPSALNANNASILGAASLIWHGQVTKVAQGTQLEEGDQSTGN